MIGLAFFALIFWIFSDYFNVNATTIALSVMIAMVLLNVITWDDVLTNKAAWGVLVQFGSLVTLADGLKNVGFLSFIADFGGKYLSIFGAMEAMIGLIVLFYLLHYFFDSTTAHVTSLLALFIAVAGIINGIDVR